MNGTERFEDRLDYRYLHGRNLGQIKQLSVGHKQCCGVAAPIEGWSSRGRKSLRSTLFCFLSLCSYDTSDLGIEVCDAHRSVG